MQLKEKINDEIISKMKKMMMMASCREGYEAKKEGDNNINKNIEKFSKASSSSRQWSGFRNPRIVRVSRSFGGKDRHSKVCTIRGLRDRRIRLSVPTAVQLYDLQDKLGLSQPSKVIDWLLEATKFEIDKLPPLQFPQGFSQFHHPQTLLPFHDDAGGMARPRYWDNHNIDSISRLRGKEAEKGKWIKTNEPENQDGFNSLQVSTQKLFPMGTTHSPLPLANLLNNPNMSYNSYHSEPSALSLSQFGSHGLFPSQVDLNPSSANGVGVQFLPSSVTPSIFTTYAPFMNTSVENDPRQFNHIQLLNSASQFLPHHPLIHSFSSPVRPFPAPPFSSKLLDSDSNSNNNNNRIQQHKGGTCS